MLITGGCGFIGSHLSRSLVRSGVYERVVVLDALTYAGNLDSLQELQVESSFCFEFGDITDRSRVEEIFQRYRPHYVLHLAAESHVDRSINSPAQFVLTNVLGTHNLLEASRQLWQEMGFAGTKFVHVSTDEVYGSLGQEGLFTEDTPYQPHSPYSASKAGSDHLARAYYHTYGLPVVVTNGSNTYGPYQHPEKLIPTVILNLIAGQPLPVYGKGINVRDWLWVGDHVAALQRVLEVGLPGQTYLIGGNTERTNLQVVSLLCEMADELLSLRPGTGASLIEFVSDRPGHDFRYALDTRFTEQALNWRPKRSFDSGLRETFQWYLHHRDWVAEMQAKGRNTGGIPT